MIRRTVDFMGAYMPLEKRLYKNMGDIGMLKAKNETYTQVLLTRRLAGNIYRHVTIWVPTAKAVLGTYQDYDGNTWLVAEKYSSYSKEHVLKYPKEFKVLN